jgi:hypothetical protein
MESRESYDTYTDPNITYPRIEALLVQTLEGYLLTAWLRRNAYGHRQEVVLNFRCTTRKNSIVAIRRLCTAHRAKCTADDITEIRLSAI